jgi:hypothetical protein
MPSRFLVVVKVSHSNWKNEATDKAIKVKLYMLFTELRQQSVQ